ncbi:DUF397 domain-containing protein [Actinomadura flavalba]|uniref:DUF397 domain-containing protein n=1 Tax=Actinomadura flavalba TaxID=1120938 RepID=UPI000363FCDB|nr:DUF397 domain-containing protein [Actinomadura flavalba]
MTTSLIDEYAATWRKSTRSSNNGGACVEVASLSRGVGVRDSKNPRAGNLALDRGQFGQLLVNVKAGTLDLP